MISFSCNGAALVYPLHSNFSTIFLVTNFFLFFFDIFSYIGHSINVHVPSSSPHSHWCRHLVDKHVLYLNHPHLLRKGIKI